jgi:anthranilate/para-aminobenzoate synthase component I
MEEELRHSIKDEAELNMIIDLLRNDLGKVCRIGTVKVAQHRRLIAHPTLIHAQADIEGDLRDDVDFVDLLHAIFPGGSVTGAPKIRAMEIIEEIEPVRRGPYCGAIGVLDSSGQMLFNLAIRTVVFKNKTAYAHFGGGIVADSTPSAEYHETLVKSRAILRSFNVTYPPDGL